MELNNMFNQNFSNATNQNKQFSANAGDFLQYNVNRNHPLIENANQYFYYKKYVSIHSEDRDIIKYPMSSFFEIDMPEDLNNVLGVSLSTWTFPSNYDTFSELNSNILMTFQINNPYNPGANAYNNDLQQAIFEALYDYSNKNYVIMISEGFYTPDLIVTELTNRFNSAVTDVIKKYFENQGYTSLLAQFLANGGYTDFVIVYNSVQQKIWFGNQSSGFILTNDSQEISNLVNPNINCINRNQLPEFSNWGLPSFIGLSRCAISSVTTTDTPRFYYGDVTPGDNGYWLLPNPSLPGATVSYVKSPFKINLMGPSYIYMEINGLNCIDETSPYNLSSFTLHTNETNGVVNSSFAKIPVTSTPLSQFFDTTSGPHKYFLPPADKFRRLKIRLRYHNGQLVNFNNFDFSFSLVFTVLSPQIERKYSVFNPIFI